MREMNPKAKTIIWVCIFSIAMAALESAVVVYLRALYYPDGFTVAFKIIDEAILKVELLREIATLVMLLAIGYLAGHNFKTRFACFILSFAIWDIFYYLWLKVLINWPASLLEWDILFLIPITWLGPVLAPLICSLAMIVLALVLLRDDKGVIPLVWLLLGAGSGVILYAFMEGYGRLIINNGLITAYPDLLNNARFMRIASGYMPEHFNWSAFSTGTLMLATAIAIQFCIRPKETLLVRADVRPL